MKVKEAAQKDLADALQASPTLHNGPHRNFELAGFMQRRGWTTVDMNNIVEVARDLGFPVVGTTIYELDD